MTIHIRRMYCRNICSDSKHARCSPRVAHQKEHAGHSPQGHRVSVLQCSCSLTGTKFYCFDSVASTQQTLRSLINGLHSLCLPTNPDHIDSEALEHQSAKAHGLCSFCEATCSKVQKCLACNSSVTDRTLGRSICSPNCMPWRRQHCRA